MIHCNDLNPNKKTKPTYGACISISKAALAEILHFPKILKISTCQWNHKNESLEITMYTDDPKTLREVNGIPIDRCCEGAESPNVSSYISKIITEFMTDKRA